MAHPATKDPKGRGREAGGRNQAQFVRLHVHSRIRVYTNIGWNYEYEELTR